MAFSNSSRFCTVLLNKIQTLQVVNSREKHLGRLSRYNKRAYPTRKHQTFPGIVTDIKYYQDLDISHLHRWEPRSPKRKFELKLKEMERKNYFSSSQKEYVKTNSNPLAAKAEQTIETKAEPALEPIKIPNYIERSPSDILRAIASTVTRDKNAPDYMYHDDPFLIPYNSLHKKDFILSKDAGRRAARYVFDNHPELFENNLVYDEPKIR